MVEKFFKWLWSFLEKSFRKDALSIVQRGNHEEILQLLKREEEIPPVAQMELVKRGNIEEIETFLLYKTPCLAVCDKIVDRNKGEELAIFCARNSDIKVEWYWLIIANGHHEAIMAMLAMQEKNPYLSVDAKLAIIGRNNVKEIVSLMNYCHLSEKEMLQIIQRGIPSEIRAVVGTLCSSDVVYAAVCQGDHDTRLYIVNNKASMLSEKAVLKVLEFDDKDEILSMFRWPDIWYPNVQETVVRRQRLSEITAMLEANDRLQEKTCRLLIEDGCIETIKKLIETQSKLSDSLIEMLLLRNNPVEINLLVEHHEVSDTVLLQWIQRCRFDYVGRYVMNHCTDSRLTQLMLIELLKRTC